MIGNFRDMSGSIEKIKKKSVCRRAEFPANA